MEINFNYLFKDLDGKTIKTSPAYSREALQGIADVLGIDPGILINKNPKRAAASKAIKAILAKEDQFSLRKACTDSLLVNYQDEKIDGSEKARRYALAMKIHSWNGIIDLKSEDIVLIKNLIAKNGSPLLVGQAYEVLESKPRLVKP